MNSKNTKDDKYRMNKLENLLIDIVMSIFIVLLLLFFVKNSSNQSDSSYLPQGEEGASQGERALKSEEVTVESIAAEKDLHGVNSPVDEISNLQKSPEKREKEKNSKKQGEKKELVNINTATLEELKTLPGIGDSTAKGIIAYREEHGTFKKISDLKRVSGIGEAKFNKLKDSICVE